jgi:CubicO group peptidase (beta-lactamase class C family)
MRATVGRATRLLVLALVAATVGPAAAGPDLAGLDSVVSAEMKASGTPGASIAIVLGDSVVYARGFGVASVEGGEAVTPATLFRVASTTKMLVAAALAALGEEGKVDFSAPISRYARDLDPAIGRLTIHQLLSHTAGLADESSFDGPHDEDALGAFVRSWRADRLFTEPGDVYSYSNPGYALAGHVLASAADTSLDAAMAAHLFRPLGMERSTLLPTAAMTWPHAQAHDLVDGAPRVVRPFPDDARFRPNGGAFTSALEFARFARAVLNEGRLDGRAALAPGAVARLLATHLRRPGSGPADSSGVAYGLVERRHRGVRVLQHGGARLGSGSVVRFAPEHRFAIVILTNRSGSFLPQALEWVSARFLPFGPPPPPRPALATPPPVAVLRELAGTYVNHPRDLVIELFLAGTTLRLRRPGQAEASDVTPLGESLFAFAGQEMETIRGSDGRTRYLHVGGRAFRRVVTKRR